MRIAEHLSPWIAEWIPVHKYLRVYARMGPTRLKRLMAAIGNLRDCFDVLLAEGADYPEIEFHGMGHERLQNALRYLALRTSTPKDFFGGRDEWTHERAGFSPDFQQALAAQPATEWAAGLTERELGTFLHATGEFETRFMLEKSLPTLPDSPEHNWTFQLALCDLCRPFWKLPERWNVPAD